MPDFTTYECKVPTRWDTIARKKYGDATRTEELIAANGSIPTIGYIPQGTVILCPVLTKQTNSVTTKPPWAD